MLHERPDKKVLPDPVWHVCPACGNRSPAYPYEKTRCPICGAVMHPEIHRSNITGSLCFTFAQSGGGCDHILYAKASYCPLECCASCRRIHECECPGWPKESKVKKFPSRFSKIEIEEIGKAI